MADPGGWAPTQENEFPSFQSNDSFNLNEVTGIDGRCCAPLFFDEYCSLLSLSRCLPLSFSIPLEHGTRAYFEILHDILSLDITLLRY